MRNQAGAVQIVRLREQLFRSSSDETPCPIETEKYGAGNDTLAKKLNCVTLASQRTGAMLIEFARQSRALWHAVGSSCFDRQTRTPVR